MKNCLTCGGLIPDPNKIYGYAGPICHCVVPPKVQRVANQHPAPNDYWYPNEVVNKMNQEAKEWEQEAKRLLEENGRLKEEIRKLKDKK